MDRDEKIKELYKKLQDAAIAFRSGDTYKEFLKFRAKFHNYSFGNQMLIFWQMFPKSATYVAGFNTWQSKFGRYVKRGEHGLAIFAPYTKTFNYVTMKLTWHGEEAVIQMRLDVLEAFRKKTHNGTYQGIPIDDVLAAFDEQSEYSKKTATVGFIPVYVFDVSQTEGREFTPPQITKLLTGQVISQRVYDVLKERIQSALGVTVTETVPESVLCEINGCYIKDAKLIFIKGSNPLDQKFKTLIHELAHHYVETAGVKVSREENELIAESVAFIASDHVGLDTTAYSVGYCASWTAEGDIFDKMTSAIQDFSEKMIRFLDSTYNQPEELPEDLAEQVVAT